MWDRCYDTTKVAANWSDKHTGILRGFSGFLLHFSTGRVLCKTAPFVWLLLLLSDILQLTFLVPKKEGLLCWVWPLEGGVVIILHAAGQVRRPTLCHRHILNQRVLATDACNMTHRRERETRVRRWGCIRRKRERKVQKVDSTRRVRQMFFFLIAAFVWLLCSLKYLMNLNSV